MTDLRFFDRAGPYSLDEQLPTLTVNFVAPAPVTPAAQPAAATADQAPPKKKK